jgi:predicted nucleotidyltransferase
VDSTGDTPNRELAGRIGQAFRDDACAGAVSVYLFGSHAEGRAHRESDVDVAVLLRYDAYPSARERFEECLRLSGALQAALQTRAIDVVVLNDAPPHLGRRIVTTGLRLLCTDLEADHTFVRDVQLRAADLEPFLRRMRRLKLDATWPRWTSPT